MKVTIIKLALFLLILPVVAAAQTPSDLEVSDPQNAWNIYSKWNFRYANSSAGDVNPFTVQPTQAISALFRNTGTKSIKKVSWQFIGYKDAAQMKIKFLYTVKNKTEILPGDSLRLRSVGVYPDYSLHTQAKIFRIEYADGSVWEGTRAKKN